MGINIEKVKGIITPLTTALTETGKIDEKGLRKCIRYVLDSGVHGLFVLGSTGEGPILTDEKRQTVAKIAVDEVAHKVPVYVGVSDIGVELVLKNIELLTDIGVDAVVACPPYYYPINDQSELLTYYKEIAQQSSLPMLLYNLPHFTKTSLAFETITELANEKNIIGIKESSGDLAFIMDLIALKATNPNFKIFQGKEKGSVYSLYFGIDGCVPGISNIIPGLCVQLYNASKSRALDQAMALQAKIDSLCELYVFRSFVSAFKTAQSMLGLCGRTVSSPFKYVSKEDEKKIRAKLIEFNLVS